MPVAVAIRAEEQAPRGAQAAAAGRDKVAQEGPWVCPGRPLVVGNDRIARSVIGNVQAAIRPEHAGAGVVQPAASAGDKLSQEHPGRAVLGSRTKSLLGTYTDCEPTDRRVKWGSGARTMTGASA